MTALILALLLAADPEVGQPVTLTLKDGQNLEGTLVHLSPFEVAITLSDGTLLELQRDHVRSVHSAVERPDDPNRTQYFFAHSAFQLHHGEWFLSVKDLSSLFVSVGLLDVLTFDLGTLAPLYVIGAVSPGSGWDGLNVMFAARGGGRLGEYVHVSTGLQGLVLPLFTRTAGGIPLSGLILANVTVGTPNAHVTLQSGLPFNLAGASPTTQHVGSSVMIALSGSVRLSRRLAVVSENWVFLGLPDVGQVFTVINSVGVRLIWRTFSLSLGIALTSTQGGVLSPIGYPVPIVDLIWNFD